MEMGYMFSYIPAVLFSRALHVQLISIFIIILVIFMIRQFLLHYWYRKDETERKLMLLVEEKCRELKEEIVFLKTHMEVRVEEINLLQNRVNLLRDAVYAARRRMI
jgi:hypothetical protein